MLRSLPTRPDGEDLPADCRWVDLIDPTEDEVTLMRERFGVDVPTVADLEKIETSSRLRARDKTLYMSAPLISGTDTDRWKLAPVGFILTPVICITVRFVALDPFDAVAKDLGENANVAPAEVLTRLLEEVVDRAADHLERASAVVNDTSQSVFFDGPKRRQLSKDTASLRDAMRTVGQVSDRTSRVRYTFLSIGRMATFVIDRCTPKIDPDIRERLEGVGHDIASLDEFEASLSGRIQLLQDAATGFISIEQNDVVKVLTVVSVVGVPPVLVVGIYGMNFRYMPELTWRLGYPYALALCLASIILPLLWFKWRDWI
ncbi:magnesium transporter [Sphingomonas koreensis]|nr:magnesium transporter [Sphingomonas koreensis]